ncbi:MAG TPA: hypothetical protein DEH25_08875 [Chloroflexi bacterium]|nr:hypothetical protein [Chloroflexota bacterium]
MIPSERSHLFASAVTHPGMTGKNNEDRYAVSAFRLEDTANTPSVFAMIADGVGGHQAGEIAAEIAVNTISHMVAISDGAKPQETLDDAIAKAGREVLAQSSKNHEQQGMGSTCVCAWVIGERLYTATVGDSRIYLLRGEKIQQISVDHTWIQEALEHGVIQPEQARNHPRSHIINRYLGSQSPAIADFRLRLSPDESKEQAIANQGLQLLPGDQLLLCSDGLSDLVEDQEILDALQNKTLSKALSALVELANQRGGHDNITILTLKVPTPNTAPITEIEQINSVQKTAFPWLIFAIISIAVVLVIILGATAFWFFGRGNGTPTPTLLPEIQIPATYTVAPDEIQPSGTPLPSETPFSETLTPWPTNPPDS